MIDNNINNNNNKSDRSTSIVSKNYSVNLLLN